MADIDLVMTPNRAMGGRELRWIVGGVGVVMALGAIRLLVVGAWPVLPFLVIDLGLLAWAFGASSRASRAVERVRLDEAGLLLRHVRPDGRTHDERFEPNLARVELEPVATGGNRLWLSERGRKVRLGSFLTAREREEVRRVLDAGLSRWRARRR